MMLRRGGNENVGRMVHEILCLRLKGFLFCCREAAAKMKSKPDKDCQMLPVSITSSFTQVRVLPLTYLFCSP